MAYLLHKSDASNVPGSSCFEQKQLVWIGLLLIEAPIVSQHSTAVEVVLLVMLSPKRSFYTSNKVEIKSNKYSKYRTPENSFS